MFRFKSEIASSGAGSYSASLKFVMGRGEKAVSGNILSLESYSAADLYRDYEFLSRKAQAYTRSLAAEIPEKAREKGASREYAVKNINSMFASAEIFHMLSFFLSSGLVMDKSEQDAISFRILERLFSLEESEFEKAKKSLYSFISCSEREMLEAEKKLSSKIQGINELLECYLAENHDMDLFSIIYPRGSRNCRKDLERYSLFLSQGLLFGEDFPSSSGCAEPGMPFPFANSIEILALSISLIIAGKASINPKTVISVFRNQGMRSIKANGLSIAQGETTKAQNKIMRTYSFTQSTFSTAKIEEYMLYTLCNCYGGKKH